MNKRLDHIAIIVRNIEQTVPFYRDILHLPLREIADFPSENIRVAFFADGDNGSQIELIEPNPSATHLLKFLEKRGEMMHHICFEVSDIDEVLRQLQAKQIRMLDQEPRQAAEGRAIFIHPKETHGVLIELLEKTGNAKEPVSA